MDILRLATVIALLTHPEPAVREEAFDELERRAVRGTNEACAECARLAAEGRYLDAEAVRTSWKRELDFIQDAMTEAVHAKVEEAFA